MPLSFPRRNEELRNIGECSTEMEEANIPALLFLLQFLLLPQKRKKNICLEQFANCSKYFTLLIYKKCEAKFGLLVEQVCTEQSLRVTPPSAKKFNCKRNP